MERALFGLVFVGAIPKAKIAHNLILTTFNFIPVQNLHLGQGTAVLLF